MGNTSSVSSSSQLTAGIRRAQDSNNKLYQLIDLRGGGELVQWTKFSIKSGDSSILDGLIEVKVQPFLYGGGKGRLVATEELVQIRHQERTSNARALAKKQRKGIGLNILENVNQEEMQGDMMKALKLLDGGKGKGGSSKYREVCCDIKQRGVMGETLLHLCLLNGTSVYNELAKKLLQAYPKLINDICISEEYYGQSALHQAIVNEDPCMVRYLLARGANVHQRCIGAFFSCDDQRGTRQDSTEHELVLVNPNTNYKGRAYWGEYPLSFAACLGQEDCFRLLVACNADLNAKDTNGNTVLHMAVINNKPHMFDLAIEAGAKLHIQNNQLLTPLTLAAKMGNKMMFDHVLKMEREIEWTYGGVTCSAYPLQFIDTIDEQTGAMNTVSALSLIVSEDTPNHLKLLDGLMEDLLREKWNAFAKKELIKKFCWFVIYFLCFFVAFYLRTYKKASTETSSATETTEHETTKHIETSVNKTRLLEKRSAEPIEPLQSHDQDKNITVTSGFWQAWQTDQCFLVQVNSNLDIVRLTFEVLTVIGAIGNIASTAHHIRRLSWRTYIIPLLQFPEKILYHLSWVIVLSMLPFRAACAATTLSTDVEHILAIMAVFATTMDLLFFCRGVKFLALFVLMIFRIIKTDMVRVLAIYMIFCISFSQAFFVIFKSCRDVTELRKDHPSTSLDEILKENDLEYMTLDGLELLFRTFLAALGENQNFFEALQQCNAYLKVLGEVLLILYQFTAQILLINMLIASVTKAAEHLGEMRNTLWRRQRAKMILLLEHYLEPSDRLLALLKYSRPIGTDRSKRAFVVLRDQNEEMGKECLEEDDEESEY